jgi:hypothetical protein
LKAEFDRFRALFATAAAREDQRTEIEAQIDLWYAALRDLSKQIADATLFLPAFDVRQAQQVRGY